MRKTLRLLWRILTFPFWLVFWVLRMLYRWITGIAREMRALLKNEPEDTPLDQVLQKAVQHPTLMLEHLTALRTNLFRASIVLLISTVASFASARQLLEWLARPVGGLATLTAVDVTEPVGMFMRVSLLAGFAIAFPYIVLELWLFIAPGLSIRSRWTGLLAIPGITLLFVGGMAFTYFVMLEPALGVLIDFMDIPTRPRPSSYIPFVTGLMFWIGVAFEFPLLLYVLAAMGLVRSKTLLEQSRIAVVALAVLAAAITPTVDPVNMLLVWGPLILLYFLGIGLAFLAEKARARRIDRQKPT